MKQVASGDISGTTEDWSPGYPLKNIVGQRTDRINDIGQR